MSDEQPYSKVTIIVETGDESSTFTFPKTRNISISHAPRWWYTDDLRRTYERDVMDITLSLTAEFDKERGCISQELRTTVAKEVTNE